MIIAINPMISNTQINSDSNYVFLREVLEEIILLRPTWNFFMFWPSGVNFKYYSDGFFEKHASRICRVPRKWQDGKYRAGSDYDVEFFYNWFTQNPFNLIWNNCIEQTPVFQNLNPQRQPNFPTPIVNFHHFPVHSSLPGIAESTYRGVQGLQAMGTCLADFNIFNSKHCQKMALDLCDEFLSQKQISEIQKNSKVLYMGPIKEGFPESTQYETPVFFYNHRIAGYKNWDETFECFDLLWKEGLKFQVLQTTVDQNQVTKVGHRPYLKVVNCFTRDQYLDVMKQANINISNSQHETFCISMVESMAAGHVPMGPNRATFPELFEHNKSGLIFTDRKSQLEEMRKIIFRKDLRENLGAEAKKRARTLFTSKRYAQEIVQNFETTFKSMVKLPKSSKEKEIKDAILGLKTGAEFLPAYREVQRKLGWANQAFPTLYFVLACQTYNVNFYFRGQNVYVRNEN